MSKYLKTFVTVFIVVLVPTVFIWGLIYGNVVFDKIPNMPEYYQILLWIVSGALLIAATTAVKEWMDD